MSSEKITAQTQLNFQIKIEYLRTQKMMSTTKLKNQKKTTLIRLLKTMTIQNPKIYLQLNRNTTQDYTQNEDNSPFDLNRDNNEDDIKKKAAIEKRKRPVIPPPFPLLPKSQLPSEPVRTGAPVPFLKLTYAKGGSNLLIEKQ
jgi:hypothetical protein